MSVSGIAKRAAAIEPFRVMDILARAKAAEAAGRDLVHMEVGEPDFPTPQPIMAAAARALASGFTHYTPAAGIEALRSAIAEHYGLRFGVAVNPRRVLLTPGATGALQLAFALTLDIGDQVLISDPGYPCNRHLARLCGAEPVAVEVGEDSAWQPSAERLRAEITERTKVIVVATPANPTGTLIEPVELAALKQLARERGLTLIVDEIYQGLTYGVDGLSAVSAHAEPVLVVNSFSKFFGMTGWRLGWLVVPEASIETAERLAQNMFLAPGTLAQHAALAAFEEQTLAILEERRQAFGRRRDLLWRGLVDAGFHLPVLPGGAFYILARLPDGAAGGADEVAQALLEEADVAVTPGRDFGASIAERWLRFAYTTSEERLAMGVERIGDWMARVVGQ